jgi:hypothetical protein
MSVVVFTTKNIIAASIYHSFAETDNEGVENSIYSMEKRSVLQDYIIMVLGIYFHSLLCFFHAGLIVYFLFKREKFKKLI